MKDLIDIIDSCLFLLATVGVVYLLVFTIASLKKRNIKYPAVNKHNRIIVLFPAYREDHIIVESVQSFLAQDYPKEYYDVVVISDHMLDETNSQLAALPIRLIAVNTDNSTKAQALNIAIDHIAGEEYDIVVILDADNTVGNDFLDQLNRAYVCGIDAMQAHRVAKNRDTDIAVLDAASEEINNSIFKKGHVNLGFSSALSGSGMAFDYQWFRKSITQIASVGEDKDLEILLLKEKIFIEYLDNVLVYDQKTQSKQAFFKQRRRWLATQYYSLIKACRSLPQAIHDKNIDYCNKIIQWIMPPRIILFGFISFVAFILLFVDIVSAAKWWALAFVLAFILALALPDKMVDKRLTKALKRLPLIFVMMMINLFRIREAKDKFIHTTKHI